MKARKYFSFGQELVFQQIDVSALKREGLQRVVNAELRVLDLVNGTHSALTEKANDSISSDQLSGCQIHSTMPLADDVNYTIFCTACINALSKRAFAPKNCVVVSARCADLWYNTAIFQEKIDASLSYTYMQRAPRL